MYVPDRMKINDNQIEDFLLTYNFGTIHSIEDGRIYSTHLPFEIDLINNQIFCHLAKSNNHASLFNNESKYVKIIFSGPHAYISSSIYEQPHVSTWNYTTTHVEGKAQIEDSNERFLEHLEFITDKFEREYVQNDQLYFRNLPLEKIVGMMQRIKLIRVDIDKIQGKFKISREKSKKDQNNILQYLENGTHAQKDMAEFMKKHL